MPKQFSKKVQMCCVYTVAATKTNNTRYYFKLTRPFDGSYSKQQRSLNDRYMLWGSSWNQALYYGYTHDFFHVPVWQPNWMVWCVMQMYRSVGYILNGEVTLALTWTISSNCLFFKRTIINYYCLKLSR